MNDRTLKYFLVYLTTIFVFGSIYFLIYKTAPASFVFNTDISHSKINKDSLNRLLHINELSKEVGEREIAINLLKNIKNSQKKWDHTNEVSRNEGGNNLSVLNKRTSKIESNKHIIKIIQISVEDEHSSYRVKTKITRFFIFNKNDELIFQTNSNLKLLGSEKTSSSENIEVIVSSFIDLFNFRIIKNKLLINELSSTSNKTARWNFIDFAYFSLVSLPIGTYGDILPNSSLVRLIIIIQTLINLYILIYLINKKL